MATLIKTDGTEEELKDTELETLQEAVGGYTETITFGNQVLIVNEEGRLMGLPQNETVSLKVCMPIVGDAVICNVSELS